MCEAMKEKGSARPKFAKTKEQIVGNKEPIVENASRMEQLP